ncbi:MAG: DUF4337 domain-containing protein [Pseudobdellovibrio sp.]
MEETEVPLEEAQEHMHETAHHAGIKWISWAALASGIVAVFAAISALLSGSQANEAMISQIKASNAWNYYQAKGVKAAVLSSKVDLLKEMGRSTLNEDTEKLKSYKEDQDKISESAKDFEKESEHHLATHETMAKSVTMFQVAIALGAIAVLSKRRKFWFVSLGFAGVGLAIMTKGLLML